MDMAEDKARENVNRIKCHLLVLNGMSAMALVVSPLIVVNLICQDVYMFYRTAGTDQLYISLDCHGA